MVISQIFILSPRGDKIISKNYRADITVGTDEVFFRKYKFWDGGGGTEAPPLFNVDGITYAYVKKNNLLMCATTRVNMSPSILSEFLVRLTKLMKDYLGAMNEEAIRKNFVLVYEILDEVIDFGFLQTTSTEKLMPYIFSDPILTQETNKTSNMGSVTATLSQFTQRTKAAADAQQTVLSNEKNSRKNEIYIDVLERLNVVFNANGSMPKLMVKSL